MSLLSLSYFHYVVWGFATYCNGFHPPSHLQFRHQPSAHSSGRSRPSFLPDSRPPPRKTQRFGLEGLHDLIRAIPRRARSLLAARRLGWCLARNRIPRRPPRGVRHAASATRSHREQKTCTKGNTRRFVPCWNVRQLRGHTPPRTELG